VLFIRCRIFIRCAPPLPSPRYVLCGSSYALQVEGAVFARKFQKAPCFLVPEFCEHGQDPAVDLHPDHDPEGTSQDAKPRHMLGHARKPVPADTGGYKVPSPGEEGELESDAAAVAEEAGAAT
jgi:hypothetical protein